MLEIHLRSFPKGSGKRRFEELFVPVPIHGEHHNVLVLLEYRNSSALSACRV